MRDKAGSVPRRADYGEEGAFCRRKKAHNYALTHAKGAWKRLYYETNN